MQQKKIVVLEGNGEAAAAISSELRNAGFEVCAVSDDGEKAEELVKEYDPDAMLVGMTLKNVDGFGVLDKLREMHAPLRGVGVWKFQRRRNDRSDSAKGRPILYDAPRKRFAGRRAPRRDFCGGRKCALPLSGMTEEYRFVRRKDQQHFISIGIPPHIKGYAYLREGN